MVSIKKTATASVYLFCVYIVCCWGLALAESADYILKKPEQFFGSLLSATEEKLLLGTGDMVLTDIGGRLSPEAAGLSSSESNLDKLPPREIAQIAREYKENGRTVTVLDENVPLSIGHLFNVYARNTYVPKDEFGRYYYFRIGRIQIVKVFDIKSVAKIVQANKELNFQEGGVFYLDPDLQGIEGTAGISGVTPGAERFAAGMPSEGEPSASGIITGTGIPEGVMAGSAAGEQATALAPFGKEGPIYKSLEDRFESERVFFAFDDSGLTESAISALEFKAGYLVEHPDATASIEGHCDERGSVEYNLALGQRRAEASRDYLVTLGVRADRISVVSFGKERPIAPGHDEKAWAANRRCEFRLN